MMDLDLKKLKKLSISERLFISSLFLSLGTGKWGAYIGIPELNIYLIDMMFLASLLLSPRLFKINRSKFLILISALYIFLEIVVARSKGFSISLYIRDLAPFIYLLTIPFVSASTSRITEQTILKCIKWACLFHVTWVNLVFFNFITTFNCSPICGVPLFIQRTDQTGFVCAIGFLAWYLSKDIKLAIRNSVKGLFLVTGLLAHSRAGLLAILVSVFITVAYDFNQSHVCRF